MSDFERNKMKKVWNLIKPTLIMLSGFILSFLIQAVIGSFVNVNSTPSMLNTILTAFGCGIIIMLLSISIDIKKSKFGFILMIIVMIIFAVLNIAFVGYDPISFIATVGNWEFSLVRMMWYDVADLLKQPAFTIEHSFFIQASSLIASIAIVISFMLLGSLFNRKNTER